MSFVQLQYTYICNYLGVRILHCNKQVFEIAFEQISYVSLYLFMQTLTTVLIKSLYNQDQSLILFKTTRSNFIQCLNKYSDA